MEWSKDEDRRPRGTGEEDRSWGEVDLSVQTGMSLPAVPAREFEDTRFNGQKLGVGRESVSVRRGEKDKGSWWS
jgi:hypothetical protein